MTSSPETLANSTPTCQNVQAYLQDIDFHLEIRPNVTDKDKLYLLRTTSSPEVRSFLDRQPANTKTDCQLLQKAVIKEFSDPESDQGLVAALETRQGRHEPPQAYYSRLRQAYFGTRNESDMEDELNFKTLFLRNTLAPDLNRGMTTGMDRVDVNAHLDDTGISHGTKQGLMRVNGIDRGTSQARMETPRESDKLEQSAQGIDERIHQDSKLTELKLNPHKNKKHHRTSTHKI